MSAPIRVLCIDDNQLLANAVERRLSMESGFQWVGWLSEAAQLVDQIGQLKPDVILLDLDMPGSDPFELLKTISPKHPETRIIIFSGYVRRDYVDRAIECGAWGYVSKNSGVDELLSAIRQVAAGEFVLTSEVMAEHRRAL
jgi:DNA-binding NarL/FixJ family response regulator